MGPESMRLMGAWLQGALASDGVPHRVKELGKRKTPTPKITVQSIWPQDMLGSAHKHRWTTRAPPSSHWARAI